jgi:CheY-like chemotaxis protein
MPRGLITPAQETRSAQPWRALCILVVDDDALIGMLLAEMLEVLGHSVCATPRTERDAIAAAKRHRPELVIMDIKLAQGNGPSAMREIICAGPMPHFFITGDGTSRLTAGALVLEKPFTEAELVKAIALTIDDSMSAGAV